MITITRRDVIAHQAEVQWPNQKQVEQDMQLCRAMVALFSDPFLKNHIAMRGGTLLHKVHLAPASRYSEDIDLVIIGDRPEEHISRAIKRVLKGVLGKPSDSVWDVVKLAVRNVVKPSRILRVTYQVPSVAEPGKHLEIIIEANATERKSYRPVVEIPFSYSFRQETISVIVNGFEIHEMLGTKMRALFQRRRGRDLFDLYWALIDTRFAVDPAQVIESFQYYMHLEGTVAWRIEFVGILQSHLKNRGFLSDMNPLLRTGLSYNPLTAGVYVIENLLNLLPQEGDAVLI